MPINNVLIIIPVIGHSELIARCPKKLTMDNSNGKLLERGNIKMVTGQNGQIKKGNGKKSSRDA